MNICFYTIRTLKSLLWEGGFHAPLLKKNKLWRLFHMKIEDIRKYGSSAKGKKDLIEYLGGQQLSARKAIRAKCYECMNGYSDGKLDCKIPGCSLYPFMPYREGDKLVIRKITDQQRMRLRQNLWKNTEGLSSMAE
jgi:hypothetical protein